MEPLEEEISQAASTIESARAVMITAGAGMGVDSGLPDFRGNEGFWRAYPPMKKLGISFVEMANPQWFRADPELAWGFYGHRLNLYWETAPHVCSQTRSISPCLRDQRGFSVFLMVDLGNCR